MGSLATYPLGNDTIFSEAGAPCLIVLDALPDFSMQDREWATSAIPPVDRTGVVQSTLARLMHSIAYDW